MQESFKLLISLAHELRQQGCYLQASKCYTAAISHNDSALPADRALACIDYSQLLIDHFDNLDLAKQLLLQAERELRSVPQNQHRALKCEIFHHLATCHRLAGDIVQAIDACRTGHALAKDQPRWRFYFAVRMAECLFEKDHDADAVLENLNQLTAAVTPTPTETALLALTRAAINLHCGRMDAADQQLTSCATALEAVVEQQEAAAAATPTNTTNNNSNAKEEEEDAVVRRLRGYYFLLYAATALAVGRAAQLQQDNEYPVFSQLQESLSSVAGHPVEVEGGGWLPDPAAAALGYMLHGAVLRAAGKGSAAAVQLGQAEELVEQALAHLKINTAKSQEHMIPLGLLGPGTVYIRLKLALGEQRTLAALVSTDLSTAAAHAADVIRLIEAFPTTLRKQVPSCCMLLGQYAHTIGEYDMAILLFGAVLKSNGNGGRNMHTLAALSAALSELHRSDDVNAAYEWLVDANLVPTSLHDMPTHEKATAQLINGLILRHRGDSTGARLLLTKSLKQAHSLIGSTQLVGQVLNVMAPVQQERGDVAGAVQMYESATTLLKSVGDLPSLVTSLKGMHGLHSGAAEQQELAVKSEQYLKRKAAALEGRLKEAKRSADHEAVVSATQWLVQQCSTV